MADTRLCICGCGEKFNCKTNSKQKYIFGHWGKVNKDWIYIGHDSNRGKKCSKEKRNKISTSLIGHSFSEETKQKISVSRKLLYQNGYIHPMKGKTHTQEAINKIKENLPNISGKNNPFYGKKHTEETKKHLSLVHGGTGIPYENTEYGTEFNSNLREQVRKQNNYTCKNCNMTEEEHLIVYGTNLHCHHIDYNKKNNDINNLIVLCHGCHHRTNYNRNYWKNKLINMKRKIYVR